MKTRIYYGGTWKGFLWALLFTCLCLCIPSVADAQQFFGARNFKPPQVGSPPASDDAVRAQWQGYYTHNPSWWQSGRTSPNGGQGGGYPTYQFPTGGGWSR